MGKRKYKQRICKQTKNIQNKKKTKEYALKERTGKQNLLLHDIKAEVLEEEVTEPVYELIIMIIMIR